MLCIGQDLSFDKDASWPYTAMSSHWHVVNYCYPQMSNVCPCRGFPPGPFRLFSLWDFPKAALLAASCPKSLQAGRSCSKRVRLCSILQLA